MVTFFCNWCHFFATGVIFLHRCHFFAHKYNISQIHFQFISYPHYRGMRIIIEQHEYDWCCASSKHRNEYFNSANISLLWFLSSNSRLYGKYYLWYLHICNRSSILCNWSARCKCKQMKRQYLCSSRSYRSKRIKYYNKYGLLCSIVGSSEPNKYFNSEAIRPYSKCGWSHCCNLNTSEWSKCMEEIQFHNQRRSVYCKRTEYSNLLNNQLINSIKINWLLVHLNIKLF